MLVDDLPDPYGPGHDLLTEWGRWNRDDREGRTSWAVKERIDPGTYGEPPERVIWLDKLLAQHKMKFRQDWSVIAQYYLDDRTVWEIAKRKDWAESRVRVKLLGICGMIDREWQDRGLT